MVNDALVEPLRDLKGDWKVFPFRCGDEIIREGYFSMDAPVCVVLRKERELWGYEIYSNENGEAVLTGGDEYFGLNSYRQAYNFLSVFSAQIVAEFGLENIVSNLNCDVIEKLKTRD